MFVNTYFTFQRTKGFTTERHEIKPRGHKMMKDWTMEIKYTVILLHNEEGHWEPIIYYTLYGQSLHHVNLVSIIIQSYE